MSVVNVGVPLDGNPKQALLFCCKFGWDGAAINVFLDSKKALSSEASVIPNFDLALDQLKSQSASDEFSGEALARLRTFRGLKPFNVLKRATVRVYKTMDMHEMEKATNLNSFDVLAVRPESDDMFSKCCDRASVDLISLDLATRSTFMTINPKNVDKVKARGAFFEIACSTAFKSNADRVSFYANARKLVYACRGSNIILSVDAKDWYEVRGPLDVINLGVMLGMTEQQANDAVKKNVEMMLERAQLRAKTYRTVAEISVDMGQMAGVEDAHQLPDESDAAKNKKKKKKKSKKKKDKGKQERHTKTDKAIRPAVKKQRAEGFHFYQEK